MKKVFDTVSRSKIQEGYRNTKLQEQLIRTTPSTHKESYNQVRKYTRLLSKFTTERVSHGNIWRPLLYNG